MTEHDSDSVLVEKGECPECGSSDACATYDDGHRFCFSCNTYFPADGEARPATPKGPSDLIRNGKYQELKKRGIFEETCRRYGYTVAERDGRKVQVATYGDPVTGEPVAQKVRTPDKDFYSLGGLKKAGLYGQHLWRTGGNKLVITEGEIDCLSVAQAQALKWPVVSLPTGAAGAARAIAAQLEWVSSYKEVVLWFDNDEPGRAAVEEVAKLLPAGKVKVIFCQDGMKDANDMLREKGAQAVVQAIWDAKAYRPDGVIAGEDLTVERLKAKTAPGWQTPYPELNKKTRGIRPRQLWLFTAGTGVGKSTDAREFMYAALLEGIKVGAVYLEESVEDTAKYLVALDNDVLAEDLEDNPELLTDAQWAASAAKLLHSGNYQAYDHFGATDPDGLLAKMEFMAANGATLLFLDHLTIATTGLENEDQDKLLVKLRSLIERTGCSVVAIAHLRKEVSGQRTAEEGAKITLSGIKGTAAFKQIPDVIVAKERDQQAENPEDRDVAMLRVLKVRRGGKTGPADYLRYDPQTGRVKPCEAPQRRDKDHGFSDEGSGNDDF